MTKLEKLNDLMLHGECTEKSCDVCPYLVQSKCTFESKSITKAAAKRMLSEELSLSLPSKAYKSLLGLRRLARAVVKQWLIDGQPNDDIEIWLEIVLMFHRHESRSKEQTFVIQSAFDPSYKQDID